MVIISMHALYGTSYYGYNVLYRHNNIMSSPIIITMHGFTLISKNRARKVKMPDTGIAVHVMIIILQCSLHQHKGIKDYRTVKSDASTYHLNDIPSSSKCRSKDALGQSYTSLRSDGYCSVADDNGFH